MTVHFSHKRVNHARGYDRHFSNFFKIVARHAICFNVAHDDDADNDDGDGVDEDGDGGVSVLAATLLDGDDDDEDERH